MQGRVWVYLIIDEAGDVVSIEPVSGEGPLLASAMAAMKQWKFEPYIQNGRAVRVSTKMYYDFAFTEKDTRRCPTRRHWRCWQGRYSY